MGNHAAEIRAQRPGLPVTRRGRNWIEFLRPDGKFETVFTLDPLHVQGTETETDTGFQPDTGAWQWKIGAADYQFHARSILNAGNLIEWRVGSQWVIFDPQSINWINQDTSRQQISTKQAVTGQANDCTLNFPNGYGAGRHFEYTALPTRLVKHWILDSLATLPAPTVTGTIWWEGEFTLSTSAGVDLYLDGVKWAKTNGVRVRTANAIEFRDAATGTQVLWRAAKPYAVDATGRNRCPAEYEVRRSGGPGNLFITVRIPRDWFLTAVYPVKVDPTLDLQPDATAGLDAAIDGGADGSPTTNFGAGEWMGAGEVNYAAAEIVRSLLKFDIDNSSNIPAGSTISSATCTLEKYGGTQWHTNARTIRFYRQLRAWVEAECTWNIYSTGNNWATAGGFGATDCEQTDIGSLAFASDEADGPKSFSLTASAIQEMISGGSFTNRGFLVKGDTESDDFFYFRTSDYGTAGERPQLVVVYTAAGGANLLALLGVG